MTSQQIISASGVLIVWCDLINRGKRLSGMHGRTVAHRKLEFGKEVFWIFESKMAAVMPIAPTFDVCCYVT